MTFGRRLWLGLLALIAPLMMGSLPASAQQPKPNILFIMGDDIGWMQPSIYHRGLYNLSGILDMVKTANANHAAD